jgi:hypothetical protein
MGWSTRSNYIVEWFAGGAGYDTFGYADMSFCVLTDVTRKRRLYSISVV